MFSFMCSKNRDAENEKLYKFTYKLRAYSSGRDDHVLLVVATNPCDAVKKFYKMVDGTVLDILEFIEMKFPKEQKEE